MVNLTSKFSNMFRVLALFSLLVLFFSCNKGTATFKINGSILDSTFGQPLVGAEVKLLQLTIGSTTYSQIASTTTAADGSYSFSFERGKAQSYIIRFSKEDYFSQEEEFSLSDLSIKETNYRNYFTTAKSWVNLRFVHTTGNSSDLLKFIKQEGKQECDECCPTVNQYINGLADTSIYCINDGNTTYSYFYWLINTTQQGDKSITTVPFDTVDLVLYY